MRRQLDSRFAWKPRDVVLEVLDWENNSADFEKLCRFVASKLNNYLLRYGKRLDEVVPPDEFREQVRSAAGRFHEKFVSLPNFVYLRLKVFVARKLRR